MLLASLLFSAAACTPLYATEQVAQDDGAIYFTFPITPGTIYRQSKRDDSVAAIAQSVDEIRSIDLDGPRIWYGTTKQLLTVAATAGAQAVLVDDTPPVWQIAHDATHIYWRELVKYGNLFASRIRRYEKRSGKVEMLLDDHQLYVRMIVTDDAIFLLSWFDDVVMLPKSGGPAVTLAKANSEDAFFHRAGGIFFRTSRGLARLPDDGAGPVVMVPNVPAGFLEYGYVGGRYAWSGLPSIGAPTLHIQDLCSGQSQQIGSYAPAYFAVDSCAMHIPFNKAVPWPAEPLRIDDIAPSHAAPGSMLTVTAAGLDRLAYVTVGGVGAGAIAIDDTHMGIFVPPLPAGAALVTITNPGGDCASMWTAIDRTARSRIRSATSASF